MHFFFHQFFRLRTDALSNALNTKPIYVAQSFLWTTEIGMYLFKYGEIMHQKWISCKKRDSRRKSKLNLYTYKVTMKTQAVAMI